MMKGTSTSLWLFLLLSKLQFCPADADHTTQAYFSPTDYYRGNATLTTSDHTNSPDADTNGTHSNCLIDTDMGLIALSSAGGLIVCLLVATVVLACQVWTIHRRVYAPRTSRSNMDLMSCGGYWGADQSEVRGLAGPCDASVMLEEVGAENKTEPEGQAEIREERKEAEVGATEIAFDPEEKACLMPSSSSRDSCLEIPRDLEDMPLVV